MTDDKAKTYDVSPKEAAIAVEEFLRDCGYIMDDLQLSEPVGARMARYDFSGAAYSYGVG